MKITFLGAAEEVTGSKYLVEHDTTKILVDCGLFQGQKESTQRNWDPLPLEPKDIDALVLTHAHIDHTGYIPLLVKKGFAGKIYCSKATYELCEILLRDNAFLQEEHAESTNKYNKTRTTPALPLYTVEDVERALPSFETIEYDTLIKVGALQMKLIYSGHILGASFVVISDGKQTLTFSGDLGDFNQPIMKSPPFLKQTDFLVVESTYGDRVHDEKDPLKPLAAIINETVARGGIIIIPAFAVGRTQTVLYCLYQLRQKKLIPNIPIFLDSPMAISVTDLFCQFLDEHKLDRALCQDVFDIATYTRTREESKQLADIRYPAIIIAGSGMAEGGRVVHHLKNFIGDDKNTVLFVGFQAYGTRGRRLVEGEKEIKIFGEWYPVRAKIEKINTLSAHADSNEILAWLSHFETKPKKVFVTHGELEAAQALQKNIEKRFGWSVVVPKYRDSFNLD